MFDFFLSKVKNIFGSVPIQLPKPDDQKPLDVDLNADNNRVVFIAKK